MKNVVMFRLLAASLLALTSGKTAEELVSENEEEKLRRLEERIFRHILKEYPEFATHLGKHEFDDTLESYSLKAFRRREEECRDILLEINKINTTTLSPKRMLDLKILFSYVRTYVEGYKWRDFGNLNPLNFLHPVKNYHSWVFTVKYKDEEDYEHFFNRLATVPVRINERIALMKRAIELNRTNHLASMGSLLDSLSPSFVQAPFYYPLVSNNANVNIKHDKWKEIRFRAQKIISQQIAPTFKKLLHFLKSEYIPASRPVEGLYSIPGGLDYYKACLKWYLGYDVSPAEIFDIGIQEVKRIEQKMKKIMKSLRFDGTLKEFFQFLKTMPNFYNRTETQQIEDFKKIIRDRVQPKLFRIFKPITLKEVCRQLQRVSQQSVVSVKIDNPWGSYGKNTFFVNLKRSEEGSTFTMLPLSLHETNPGHHFQASYAKVHHFPEYRRCFVHGKNYAVPLALPTFSTYTEGWATYAEHLGEELGLYKDPYELFGKYCLEMFRALRLVVDPGIHAFGWQREEAVDYIMKYTEFPRSRIEFEVNRYITWPGQACSYKIGELKIRKFRKRAEKKLGQIFDIKEFHDQVLRYGPMSLDILEGVLNEWMDKYTPSSTSSWFYLQHRRFTDILACAIKVTLPLFLLNLM